MPAGATTAIDLLAKTFKNTALPWDAITDIYIGLHTADPTSAGNQSISEATYTGYARIAITRGGGGWSGTNPLSNTALAQFGLCTAGTNTLTHVTLGTVVSGAGQILAVGALNSSLSVSAGIQPQFSAGALTVAMT